MLLGLETFSYHLWFSDGRMDVFRYIERCAELGLDGVQINVNGRNFGHLGGNDPGRLREIRELVEHHGMFIEIDSRGTDPEHLRAMLKLCEALGADVLRTYASCGGELARELAQAPEHLREVVPMCADLGIHIGVENHEYETSAEILEIVRGVGSEWVGTHVDTGNSMMAWEDPVAATAALAPFAVSSHFKDHIVIVETMPLVVGVTVGTGSIDCAECFRLLAEQSPLERLITEVCYGYSAPFRRSQEMGGGGRLGEGVFQPVAGPHELSAVLLSSQPVPPEEMNQVLHWQDLSVTESLEFMKGLAGAHTSCTRESSAGD